MGKLPDASDGTGYKSHSAEGCRLKQTLSGICKKEGDVKHQRLENFKKANLKNVANALAGLYILELYFVKFIGNRDNVLDVPNNISKLFELVEFQTNNTVVGNGLYFMPC